MAYKQSPVKVKKGQMTNKVAGLAHGDSMAMQLKEPKTGKKLDEFGTPIPEGFKADVKPQTLTPEKMYTRDIGKDQGKFGTSDFIPGRKYSQEKREIGSIGDRVKQKPGYRYQFTSVSGDTDPSPTNPFITKDFDEQGDVIKNAKVLGKKGASGLIGRSFSQQDVKEMKGRFERYMAPKRKAQEYFKSKKS